VPQPWTVDHDVHVFAQTESRPGPPTDEGEQWMECQNTGKVMVLCRCGYTSGLIDRTELEATVSGLAAEHKVTLTPRRTPANPPPPPPPPPPRR
jgi:hypothetical protein